MITWSSFAPMSFGLACILFMSEQRYSYRHVPLASHEAYVAN
jgi:hypothetical protein